ncbi:MAG TPA: hypothetical protein VF469_20300 [Kofleriaceae bacterium]
MAAAKKSATKTKPRALKVTSLAAATNASVKAVLKKAQIGGGGTTVGILIQQASLAARGVDAKAIAKEITANVSAATGVKLRATSSIVDGAILVGFAPPDTILKQIG